jgi:hypothetical protein
MSTVEPLELAKPDLQAVYLAHFGVKGMHWGHRKQEESSGGSSASGSSQTDKHKKAKLTPTTKAAIGASIVLGAVAAKYLISKHSTVKVSSFEQTIAKVGEKAASHPPSPAEMLRDAGFAARRNMRTRMETQVLTDQIWRDSANMSRMARVAETPSSRLQSIFKDYNKATLKRRGA